MSLHKLLRSSSTILNMSLLSGWNVADLEDAQQNFHQRWGEQLASHKKSKDLLLADNAAQDFKFKLTNCLCKDNLPVTSVIIGVHFPAKWVWWSVWHTVYVSIKYSDIYHEYFSHYRFTICFNINTPTSCQYLSQTAYDTLILKHARNL